jgi:N-acetylmuramoyl-L-alanine amidase
MGRMSVAKGSKKSSSQRKKAGLGQWLLAGLVLAGVFYLYQLWRNWEGGNLGGSGLMAFLSTLGSGEKQRIGLVAGHWKNDSGAVCPDGLTEVSINQDVAERTATLLRRAGYTVDVMREFDPLLKGYDGAAFVSIHSDSCINILSGFKVARQSESKSSEQADRLVQSLYQEYAAATGLEPQKDTITSDMREYHAFSEISPQTPAAIIEIGFMGADRQLLTRRPDLVARGIARGIINFMQPESATTATPAR